ncbi:MAG: hypothetical protein ACLFWD_13625 [Anaerolineales bacterium]
MKEIAAMTLGELAALIDSHLKKKGIAVVLSGGAAVAIYSNNKYVSKDIDFIARFSLDNSAVTSAMQELGFEKKGKYYAHPDTEILVDFIPGPPSVGDQPIGEIVELELATGSIRIISPTDSVKDRLAAFYHWGDRQGLKQAIHIANQHEVDLDDVHDWSKEEGHAEKFIEFSRRLAE